MLTLSSATTTFVITRELLGTHTGCSLADDDPSDHVGGDEKVSNVLDGFVWFTCSTRVACSRDIRPTLKFFAEVWRTNLGRRYVRDVAHACLS